MSNQSTDPFVVDQYLEFVERAKECGLDAALDNGHFIVSRNEERIFYRKDIQGALDFVRGYHKAVHKPNTDVKPTVALKTTDLHHALRRLCDSTGHEFWATSDDLFSVRQAHSKEFVFQFEPIDVAYTLLVEHLVKEVDSTADIARLCKGYNLRWGYVTPATYSVTEPETGRPVAFDTNLFDTAKAIFLHISQRRSA